MSITIDLDLPIDPATGKRANESRFQGVPGEAIFFDDFSSGNFAKTENGVKWGNTTNLGIISGFSRRGDVGSCVRFNFGIPAEAVSELRFDLGAEYPELWFEYYLYYPSGEEDVDRGPRASQSGSNNKFFRVYGDTPSGDSTGSDPRFGASYYSTTPTGDARLGAQAGKYQDGSTSLIPGSENPAYAQILNDSTRGRWIKVKMRVKASDNPTVPNGECQMWIDDIEQWNVTEVNAYSSTFSGFRKGYFQGAQDAPWDNPGTYIYMSDVTISAEPI